MVHKQIQQRIIEWSKFSDKDLINLYSKGHSDGFIAKEFKCASTSIRKRRMKLGLIANFMSSRGYILDKEELLLSRKEELKKCRIRHKKKDIVNYRKYLSSLRKQPWIKEKLNETRREYRKYRRTPEQKMKEKEYYDKYNKEHYQKNKISQKLQNGK